MQTTLRKLSVQSRDEAAVMVPDKRYGAADDLAQSQGSLLHAPTPLFGRLELRDQLGTSESE